PVAPIPPLGQLRHRPRLIPARSEVGHDFEGGHAQTIVLAGCDNTCPVFRPQNAQPGRASDPIQAQALSTSAGNADSGPELSTTKSALARRSSLDTWLAILLRTSSSGRPRATARRSASSGGQSTTIVPAVLERPDSTRSGTSRITTWSVGASSANRSAIT